MVERVARGPVEESVSAFNGLLIARVPLEVTIGGITVPGCISGVTSNTPLTESAPATLRVEISTTAGSVELWFEEKRGGEVDG